MENCFSEFIFITIVTSKLTCCYTGIIKDQVEKAFQKKKKKNE